MGNSHAAAPPAVPPVVTGTTPAVNAVPVENQVCAAPLPRPSAHPCVCHAGTPCHAPPL